MKVIKIVSGLLILMAVGHANADSKLYCTDSGGYWGAWISITDNADNSRSVDVTYQYLSRDPSTAQTISGTVQTPEGTAIDITANPNREASISQDYSMLTLSGISQNPIPMPCGPDTNP
jgi:hypothetical protein